MTLYEINAKMDEILSKMFNEVDEETGEIPCELVRELEEIKIARSEKLDNIGCYIKQLEAEADAINSEIVALRSRLKAKRNRAEWLRDYVANDLLTNDEKRFETPRVAYSFVRSEAVEVDESRLPKKFFRKKIEMSPDKIELKKHLKAGETIKGASLVVRDKLQVR